MKEKEGKKFAAQTVRVTKTRSREEGQNQDSKNHPTITRPKEGRTPFKYGKQKKKTATQE